MVQETSLWSYKALIDEGILSKMEEKVFQLIHDHPFLCDREYAELSNLKINQLTGRRNDLVDQGCVVDAGHKVDEVTNRTVLMWEVPKKITFVKKTKRIICPMCKGKGNILPGQTSLGVY